MGHKILVYIAFLLLLPSFVFSAPVFVKTISQDTDTVYGNNDATIQFTTWWNQPGYQILANFSSIDVSSSQIYGNVTTHLDGRYDIIYIINQSAPDGIYIIPITAIDNDDNSTNTSFDFNITIDNTAPLISNESTFPNVIFNITNIRINATVFDQNGIFSIKASGTWENGSYKNYSILDINDPKYVISSIYVNDDENINWLYYATDMANNEGVGIIQLIDVVSRTNLTTVPTAPNGCNGWYTIESQFLITPDIGRTGYYRFDSLASNEYTGIFNYSGIPGGQQIINYWSNDSSNNLEPSQAYYFKVDIIAPLISQLSPENGSTVASLRPTISAFVDEIYFDNSGINESSIIMQVDGQIVNHDFDSLDTIDEIIDGTIKYTPAADLALGLHNVTIVLKDNACINSTRNWHFFINDSIPIINISFPYDGFESSERRVLLNVSASLKSKIKYSVDNGPQMTMCSKCTEVEKSISLRNGNHNISIVASNSFNGAESSENVTVFVDATKPRIKKTEPLRRKFGFGTFNVTYNEDFMQNIDFYIKGENENFTQIATGCNASGSGSTCEVQYNLSAYNLGQVTYYFNVSDLFRSTSSKPTIVFVDLIAPQFLNMSPSANISNSSYVYLGAGIDKKVKFLKYSDNNGDFKSLCSRCNDVLKRVRFEEGHHNITFYAEDYAGNNAFNNIEFDVILA